MEIWKDIPEYEGCYQVSNLGNVKRVNGKILKPQSHTKFGHLRVGLWKDGKCKYKGVHNLVLLSFIGECPKGMEIRHLNSNPSDNKLSNLKYGTRSENMIDAAKLSRCGSQKLTINNVHQIRRLHNEGLSNREIAERFKVDRCTVRDIITKKTYKWLEV